MPLDIPETPQEVVDRSKADVQRELQESNPFGKNHWLGAIITAFAIRVHDFYLQLLELQKQSFADTATGTQLTRLAAIWGISANASEKSSGTVVATGTATSVISSGETLSVAGVGIYSVTSDATISAQSINIDSLARVGTTVTATTASNHNLANDVSVTVSGAANSEYNITDQVTVTALDQFQYEIVGTPADEPATSATASFTTASVSIESDEFGADYNLDAGTKLTLQSTLPGVDDTMTVDFGGIIGGADEESESNVRLRLLDRIQNPVANFNVSAVEQQAKLIQGVTRVFVNEVTPALGQVTVYFMRDNDDDPIPSSSQVNEVKDKLLEIKPVGMSSNDLIVASPTAVYQDFTFTDLDPNTSTMKSAINANLNQFFAESTQEGVDVDQDAYRSAIFNTVDLTTGDIVNTFTLSAPSGDISVSAGEIAQRGNVTYP